jgi:hypothetical protein
MLLGLVACQDATGPPTASVVVIPDTVVIVIGTSAPFKAEVRDASGALLVGAPVAWGSSDTLVVKITQAGMATATGLGVANVSATSRGVTGKATVYASFLCPCAPSAARGDSGTTSNECSCRP